MVSKYENIDELTTQDLILPTYIKAMNWNEKIVVNTILKWWYKTKYLKLKSFALCCVQFIIKKNK